MKLVLSSKIIIMNKKIITGAVIALAAGIAAYVYNRNRSRINSAAQDAYDKMNDTIGRVESKTDNIFS